MKNYFAGDCLFCDDDYFTRDDEIEYIETPLYDQFHDITACRAYIDPDDNGHYLLSVDISNTDGYEFTLETIIDMRRIRKPADLQKYADIIANKYLAEIQEVGQ